MKKKIDELTKMKLIYSGELFLFAIVGAVLGTLFIVDVIHVKDWKKWVFTILTLIGGIYFVVDLIWSIVSKKKRKKVSLFDKITVAPSGLTLFCLDIYALINLIKDPSWTGANGNFFRYEIGIALCYIAVIYIAQGIFHLYKPHPSIIEAIEEEKREKEKQLEQEKLSALEDEKKEN